MSSESWLGKYRGSEVEVIYLTDSSTYRDRGTLTDFGDQWLEIVKAANTPAAEVFVVPMTAVRLIKILRPASAGAATTLLRPAGPPEIEPSSADIDRELKRLEERLG